MKKQIIVFTLAIALVIGCFGALGSGLISRLFNNEIMTVQNVAGAVLSEYPQAEEKLIAAVLDDERRDAAAGAEFMRKYGYDTGLNWSENLLYRQASVAWFGLLLLFLVATLGVGCSFLFGAAIKQRRQEDAVLKILDSCLSENYEILREEEPWRYLQNTVVADNLHKICEKLKLKTEYLTEERDNTKTLVTDISHQLKTPISALQTCFSMYLESDSEGEKQEFLTRSRVQMDKLEALTGALINISRLENSMIILKKEKTAVGEILIGAVDAVYHKAMGKGIDIVTADFEDLELYLDKKWTVEALANILDNGIKYSPKGTTVEISVQKLYSFVRIEIADQGIGIPSGERNLIFKRFYRGNSETVKSSEGSGVGLYLTRKILEEQGGTVFAAANREGGSVFAVQLPF